MIPCFPFQVLASPSSNEHSRIFKASHVSFSYTVCESWIFLYVLRLDHQLVMFPSALSLMQLQRLQDHIHLEVNGLFTQGYGIPILAKRCHSDQCWFTWISNQVLLLHLLVWQRLGESDSFRPICQVCSTCSSFFILNHSDLQRVNPNCENNQLQPSSKTS